VHLVGLIIRIYHDARSPERQIVAQIQLKTGGLQKLVRQMSIRNRLYTLDTE